MRLPSILGTCTTQPHISRKLPLMWPLCRPKWFRPSVSCIFISESTPSHFRTIVSNTCYTYPPHAEVIPTAFLVCSPCVVKFVSSHTVQTKRILSPSSYSIWLFKSIDQCLIFNKQKMFHFWGRMIAARA
jgi:hypothetical protein